MLMNGMSYIGPHPRIGRQQQFLLHLQLQALNLDPMLYNTGIIIQRNISYGDYGPIRRWNVITFFMTIMDVYEPLVKVEIYDHILSIIFKFNLASLTSAAYIDIH